MHAFAPNPAGRADRFGLRRLLQVIIREIPQLRDDKPVLALLAPSVDGNVDTWLQMMQHRIDLAAGRCGLLPGACALTGTGQATPRRA